MDAPRERTVKGRPGTQFKVREQPGHFEIPAHYAAAGRRTDGRRSRWRTLSIEGTIRNFSGRSGKATGLRNTRAAVDDRGHLVADRFGGPRGARSGNIVPMHALQNSSGGHWYLMEEQVAELLGGGTGSYRVACHYRPDNNTIRPDQLSVTFTGRGRKLGGVYWNFSPHIFPSSPFEPLSGAQAAVEQVLDGTMMP